MSYVKLDDFNSLKSKRVLFIDIETTGLPNRISNKNKPEEVYFSHTSNMDYDNSRIVQIGWKYYKNFDADKIDIDNIDKVKNVIIKPKNFIISKNNTSIHKISHDMAVEKGMNIRKILNGNLGYSIENCDKIVAYNAFFDVKILMNEMYRIGYNKILGVMENMVNKKNILCVGQLARLCCNPDGWICKFPYQIPSQQEVYKKCFEKDINGAHNAQNDVVAMISIVVYILKKK
jgi:DNA polymerase III epsilon subunit-like protein